MPLFVRGDVVWVQFPFSEEADFKLRPAVVLALWPYQNSQGSVNRTCDIRPDYVFTAGERFIQRRLGTLKDPKTQTVISSVIALLHRSSS